MDAVQDDLAGFVQHVALNHYHLLLVADVLNFHRQQHLTDQCPRRFEVVHQVSNRHLRLFELRLLLQAGTRRTLPALQRRRNPTDALNRRPRVGHQLKLLRIELKIAFDLEASAGVGAEMLGIQHNVGVRSGNLATKLIV